MKLKAEQQRLYALLPEQARCFVRICDDDSALWVSDLPRKMPDCASLIAPLRQAGFAVRLDEEHGLWFIDWTAERWAAIISALPARFPALPENERYHEVYALCRLLLLHPAPFEQQPLQAVRRAAKAAAQPPQNMLRIVRGMHEQAAAQLRSSQPLAYAAGRILAAWLEEHDCGKGNER